MCGEGGGGPDVQRMPLSRSSATKRRKCGGMCLKKRGVEGVAAALKTALGLFGGLPSAIRHRAPPAARKPGVVAGAEE